MKQLTKKEKEIYENCYGNCLICIYDGGCNLQDKLHENLSQYEENDNG